MASETEMVRPGGAETKSASSSVAVSGELSLGGIHVSVGGASAAGAGAPPPSSSSSSIGEAPLPTHEVNFYFDPQIQPEYFFEARPAPHAAVSTHTAQPVGGAKPATAAPVTPPPKKTFPVFQYLGSWLSFAAFVLFIISISTDELQTQQKVAFQAPSGAWVVGSQRIGAWSVCIDSVSIGGVEFASPLGAVCGRISSDKDCSVAITHPTAGLILETNLDQCPATNGIRAMTLLAIFASGLSFVFGRMYLRVQKDVNFQIALWSGLAAALFGMISMAIATDKLHSDALAMNEYGSSFWILVISWPIQTIAAVFFALPPPKDIYQQKSFLGYFASAVTLLVFTFMLISISSRELTYTTSIAVGNNALATTQPVLYYTRTTQGYWSSCTYNGNSTAAGATLEQTCSNINSACELSNGGEIGSCDTLRTIRTWVIVSTIASLFAAFVQYRTVKVTDAAVADAIKAKVSEAGMAQVQGPGPYPSVLLGLLTVALGFMATALQVDYYVQTAGNWGFSFWLCLIAWVFELVAIGAFAYEYHEPHVRRVLTSLFVTFIAGIGMLTAISMPHWVYVNELPLFNDPFFAHSNFQGRPLQYGLWRLCVGGNDCKPIKSDSTCAVSDGAYPSLYPCDTFNGIRASTLLSLFSVGLVLICQFSEWRLTKPSAVAKPTDRPPTAARIAAIIFGIVAVFWGFLGTIVTVDFFDVRTSEYAFSFWLWLVSWFLVVISISITLGNFITDRNQVIGVFGTILSLILFIISTGAAQYVRNDQEGRLTVSRRMDSIGMFYSCTKETGQGNEICNFIAQDCVPKTLTYALANCDQFNAIRAFNVLALLVTGVQLLPQLVYGCLNQQKDASARWWAKRTAVVFGGIAGFFGMISMALALDYYSQHSTTFLGFSFWLQVIAWLLVTISSYTYNMSGMDGEFGDKTTGVKTRPAGPTVGVAVDAKTRA